MVIPIFSLIFWIIWDLAVVQHTSAQVCDGDKPFNNLFNNRYYCDEERRRCYAFSACIPDQLKPATTYFSVPASCHYYCEEVPLRGLSCDHKFCGEASCLQGEDEAICCENVAKHIMKKLLPGL